MEFETDGETALADAVTRIQVRSTEINVEYDVNGNPLRMEFEDPEETIVKFMEWQDGRRLSAMYISDDLDAEIEDAVCIARYTYDENGIRTSKTVEGVTTYFVYEGTKLYAYCCGDPVNYIDSNGH